MSYVIESVVCLISFETVFDVKSAAKELSAFGHERLKLSRNVLLCCLNQFVWDKTHKNRLLREDVYYIVHHAKLY